MTQQHRTIRLHPVSSNIPVKPNYLIKYELLDKCAKEPKMSDKCNKLYTIFSSRYQIARRGSLTIINTGISVRAENSKMIQIFPKFELLRDKKLFISNTIFNNTNDKELKIFVTNFGISDYHFKIGDVVAEIFVD